MTRSIALATLVAAALAGCAQKPAEPPPVAAASPAATSPAVTSPAVTGFVPYCGPIWSVDRQGYVDIPCPAGSNYDGPR
jgi:hypothetical protein